MFGLDHEAEEIIKQLEQCKFFVHYSKTVIKDVRKKLYFKSQDYIICSVDSNHGSILFE